MSINEEIEIERVGRGINKKMYHYKLQDINNEGSVEYYKTIRDITDKHGISRGNVYLMLKNENTDIKRRKYAHIKIERIKEHYLSVEHGVDPSVIIW